MTGSPSSSGETPADEANMENKVAGLHTEVGELHVEVAELNAEVAELHLEVGHLPTEVKDLQAEVTHLAQALDSSRDISAAVGIVMERLKLSQSDAFDLLVKTSQRLNVKLHRVADDIVESGTLPAGITGGQGGPSGRTSD